MGWKLDDPAVRAAKWTALGAVIVAIVGLIGVMVRSCINEPPPPPKRYVNGTVITDDWKQEPVKGINVLLYSLDGKLFSQDKTDQEGKYSLEIPGAASEVRIVIQTDGFFPYDRKIPISSANSISLKRLPQKFGIPDNTALESAVAVIEHKLGIAAPFSSRCSSKAKKARVHGVELEAYRTTPEEVIRELTNMVKVSSTRYEIGILEPGRRYEIKCF